MNYPHYPTRYSAEFADLMRISELLDDDLSHLDKDFLDHLRVSKIGEEFGEAMDKLIGWQAVNPRKGKCAELDDVLKELYDVALTALGAAIHLLDGNRFVAEEQWRDHVRSIMKRYIKARAEAEQERR